MLRSLLLRFWAFSVGLSDTRQRDRSGAGNGRALRVSFQRHAYELGEHYNSLVPGTPLPREKPEAKPAPSWQLGMQIGV